MTDWTAYNASSLADFLGAYQDMKAAVEDADSTLNTILQASDEEVREALYGGDIPGHMEAIMDEINSEIIRIEDAMDETPEAAVERQRERDAQNRRVI